MSFSQLPYMPAKATPYVQVPATPSSSSHIGTPGKGLFMFSLRTYLATTPEPVRPPGSATQVPRATSFQDQNGNPNQAAQTKRQQEMLRALDEGGQWELAMVLYRIAREEERVDPSNSWRKFYEDQDRGEYKCVLHLYSLPTYILRALIEGTLTYKMATDAPTRKFVAMAMHCDFAMGIYINLIHQPIMGPLAVAHHPDEGKWFLPDTFRDWDEYFDTSYSGMPNAARNAEAKKVDLAMLAGKAADIAKGADPKGRRYLKDGLVAHFQALKHYYGRNLPASSGQAFLRVPAYIGCSQDIRTRLGAHRTNANTNDVFGFWNAGLVNSSRQVPKFELTQLVVFPQWAMDYDLLSKNEIMATMLASSYTRWAGMNHHPAGTAATPHPQSRLQADDLKFDRTRTLVFGRHHIARELHRDWEILIRRRDLHKDFAGFAAQEKEANDAAAAAEKAQRDRNKQQAENKKLEGRIRDLQNQINLLAQENAKNSAAAQRVLDRQAALQRHIKARDDRERAFALARERVADPDLELEPADVHLEDLIDKLIETRFE